MAADFGDEDQPASSTTEINISDSQFQIGNHNTMVTIVHAFETLIQQIEESDASEEEKRGARQRIADLLKHPLVVKALGEAAEKLPALLATLGA